MVLIEGPVDSTNAYPVPAQDVKSSGMPHLRWFYGLRLLVREEGSLSDGGILSIPVRGESPDLKTTRLTVGTAIGRRLGAAKGTDPHRNRGTVRISVRPCCSLPQVPSAERTDIPSLLDLFFTSGTSIDTIA